MRNAQKILMLVFAVVSVANAGCCCTTVPPGFVGIRVNMYGNQKGVEDFPIETGRVWYNPWTEDIHTFPTFAQNAVWSKDSKSGDESITFNSSEGAVVNADCAISYAIKSEKVPHIFVELRQDAEYITHTWMRAHVRDSFSRHAAEMKVTDIFGNGKQTLLDKVKKDLKDDLEERGFVIDMISLIGEMRVDERVKSAINATIEATQRAIEAQNKVVQSKAEAEQQIEKARGEAESILIEAKAKADANKQLTASLTPELISYEALQKWDGKMPQVVGGEGAMPFISIPTAKK